MNEERLQKGEPMRKTLNEDDVLKEIDRWIGYLDEDMITRIKIGIKKLPSAQPEQAVKDCRTCKHGKYNDYHDTYFCYNAEDCSNWDKWETSAQPDITLESAIDYLHSIGWIQEHDRILTESAQTEHNSDDERKIADLHKMVNYLLSRLESQWIPVSEGLPKEYGEYICTMENGQVQECGFVPENQRGLVDGWSTCEADGHKFLGYADVLAWMPLPDPYKDDPCNGCGYLGESCVGEGCGKLTERKEGEAE